MSISADVIDRMWDKFGMAPREGRDHWVHLWVGEKWILSTRRSHGRGKISDFTATLIRQQMKLNEAQFRDAIKCPLNRDGFIEILRAKRLIESK